MRRRYSPASQRKGWYRNPDSFQPKKAGKRGKYGSVSANYNGRIYHSRAEALYAAQLDTLRKATMPSERVVEVIPQYAVPLTVNGRKIATWYADFKVKFADGREEIHEVKGFETDIWLRNRKHFEAEYPNMILKVIKV